MSKTISVKKGSIGLVAVLVGYGVAAGAQAIAKATGIDIPLATQEQCTLAVTAAVSGLIIGGLNWLKHRGDKKPVILPKD